MRIGLPPVTIHELFDVCAFNLEWYIGDYGIDKAHPRATGKGRSIGFVDTGLDRTHAQNTFKHVLGECRDFTKSQFGWNDLNGHGTHVFGIAHRVAPGATKHVAKALGDSGGGSDQDIAEAILWLDSIGCDVINLSLGSSQPSYAIESAIAKVSQRRIIFAATGNDGGRVSHPGASRGAVGTGAIDQRRLLARFSNRGEECEVVGPGVRLRSEWVRGGQAVLDGTSMATPWAAAHALLKLEHEKGLRGTKWILDMLPEVCIDLGKSGRDPLFGHGVFDVEKLLAYGAKPSDPEPPKDDDGIADCLKLVRDFLGSLSSDQKQSVNRIAAKVRKG